MNLPKSICLSILIVTPIIYLSNKFVLSEEKNSFSIISDTQAQSNSGNFEASGNVIIKNETDFSARSDKLIFEKNDSKIFLKGNVKIKNYKLGNVIVENLESDELIIFTNKDGFQTNSKNGNRVKTKLKF